MRTDSKRILPDAWWFSMSRNGIRSLVIVLAIGVVFWAGLAVEIMHFTGVLNG